MRYAMIAIAAVAGAATAPTKPALPRGCSKLYGTERVKADVRAAYKGTRDVSRARVEQLRHEIRCRQDRSKLAGLRRYLHRSGVAWSRRRWEKAHPWFPDVASWYDDGGATACGFHAGMGVANRTMPCGARVTFRYGGRQVDATVDDRGPFVGGRDWDLNQNVAAALGFSGVRGIMVRIP